MLLASGNVAVNSSFFGHSIIESSSVGQIPAVCGERTILLPIGTPPLGFRCFPRPCQEQELKVLKQNYEKRHGSMGSMAMDPATHHRNGWFDFAFMPHDIGVISYHRKIGIQAMIYRIILSHGVVDIHKGPARRSRSFFVVNSRL